MTFWNWRRGTGTSSTQGTAAVASVSDLAPMEVYTADARIVAWVAPNGRRVTDLLNEQDELQLWRPSPGPLGGDSIPAEAHAGSPSDDPGEWQTLETACIILAMPPEWRASRQLRLHRRLRRAALVAGPFSVTGNIHLHPGVEVGPHLLRGQSFLPLTDGHILYNGEPSFEHVVSVVIVNVAHVSQIVPLVTLA